MATLLRLRSARPILRRFTSDYAAQQKAIEKHAAETATTWKYISLLVGIPACGFLFYKNIINGEEEHHGEYVPYEHMRIRKVPFPWGEESLFHSKHSPGPNKVTDEHEEVAKENFITAYIRKLRDEHVEEDWKIQMEHVERCHQKMMEHIERKKFPKLPPLPRYSRLFSYPAYDLQDSKHRRPIGFND